MTREQVTRVAAFESRKQPSFVSERGDRARMPVNVCGRSAVHVGVVRYDSELTTRGARIKGGAVERPP